jgi:hypothetical protein
LASTGGITRILVALTLVVPAACGGEVDPPSERWGRPRTQRTGPQGSQGKMKSFSVP